MLMKVLLSTGPTTVEEYRRRLYVRSRAVLGISVLGAITLVTTLLFMGGRISDTQDLAYLQGVWCGIGSGLIVAGLLFFFKLRATLKDDERLRRMQLEEQDERNQAINSKSLAMTSGICIAALYIAIMVFSFLNLATFKVLVFCTVAVCLVFLLCRIICSRQM